MLWWISRQLKSKKLETKLRAVRKLGVSKSRRATDLLLGALGDDESWVRQEAVEALGKIRDPRALEPLVSVLEDKNWFVRRSTVIVLEALGWQPSTNHQRALLAVAHRDWNMAVEIGGEAVEHLSAALGDDSLFEAAAVALGEIRDLRGVKPISLKLLLSRAAVGSSRDAIESASSSNCPASQ